MEPWGLGTEEKVEPWGLGTEKVEPWGLVTEEKVEPWGLGTDEKVSVSLPFSVFRAILAQIPGDLH